MMKTRKQARLFLFSVIMMIMLSGCSTQKGRTDIDISGLCSELLEKAEFEDELNTVDDAIIKMLYGIDDYVEAAVYLSSGATAEEIAVFEFDSKETAADALKKARVRIEEQKKDFESYIPKEIPKLDRAVVIQSDSYVIVCVSNSDKAEEIITQYISG